MRFLGSRNRGCGGFSFGESRSPGDLAVRAFGGGHWRFGEFGFANYQRLMAAHFDRASGVRLIIGNGRLAAPWSSVGSLPSPVAQLFGELAGNRIAVALGVARFFFVGRLTRSFLRTHLFPSAIASNFLKHLLLSIFCRYEIFAASIRGTIDWWALPVIQLKS